MMNEVYSLNTDKSEKLTGTSKGVLIFNLQMHFAVSLLIILCEELGSYLPMQRIYGSFVLDPDKHRSFRISW